jgi:hypothetical protein
MVISYGGMYDEVLIQERERVFGYRKYPKISTLKCAYIFIRSRETWSHRSGAGRACLHFTLMGVWNE